MSVTWLATALLLSLAVSGTSSTTPELELGLNNNQLAVLVPPTHLVTFTPSVSVGVVLDALTARLPLQPLQKCGFSTSAGISVVRGKIFRDVLLATVPQLAAVDLRRGLPKGLVLGVVTCSGEEAWKVVSAPDQHRSHAGGVSVGCWLVVVVVLCILCLCVLPCRNQPPLLAPSLKHVQAKTSGRKWAGSTRVL